MLNTILFLWGIVFCIFILVTGKKGKGNDKTLETGRFWKTLHSSPWRWHDDNDKWICACVTHLSLFDLCTWPCGLQSQPRELESDSRFSSPFPSIHTVEILVWSYALCSSSWSGHCHNQNYTYKDIQFAILRQLQREIRKVQCLYGNPTYNNFLGEIQSFVKNIFNKYI